MTNVVPEYLTADEIAALIHAAPHGPARLIMTLMWRAGLRVSEALALERRDLDFDDANPVLRVRLGKGNRSRLVPAHPALISYLTAAVDFAPGSVRAKRSERTPICNVTRRTVNRWIRAAVDKAVSDGKFPQDRKVSAHTFRHSYARHMLANGVPINVVSRWLGHKQLQTTLTYLNLLPDPAGQMAEIP